jgi:hypothetical protein
MAIIRNRKKVEPTEAKQAPPETAYADIGEALVMDLEPEPAAVEEAPAAKEPAKRGRGRPKGSTKERELPILFDLPDGMTDDIMAWACDVSPDGNAVYRWRTGFNPMPDIGHLMIALWEALGEEEFLRIMTMIRKSAPPKSHESIREIVLDTLKRDAGPWSLEEIYQFVTSAHKRPITRGSLRTIVSRMKANGELESGGRDNWMLPGADDF